MTELQTTAEAKTTSTTTQDATTTTRTTTTTFTTTTTTFTTSTTTSTTSTSKECDPREFDGRFSNLGGEFSDWYVEGQDDITYEEAKAFCQERKSHLVHFKNAEGFEAINYYMRMQQQSYILVTKKVSWIDFQNILAVATYGLDYRVLMQM